MSTGDHEQLNERSEAMVEEAAKDLSAYMLRGWTLRAEACTDCHVCATANVYHAPVAAAAAHCFTQTPLLEDRKNDKDTLFCVTCRKTSSPMKEEVMDVPMETKPKQSDLAASSIGDYLLKGYTMYVMLALSSNNSSTLLFLSKFPALNVLLCYNRSQVAYLTLVRHLPLHRL